MKKILFLFVMVLFLTIGCKQIVIWKYGIRSPKTETPESIIAFAKKQGQSPENIYMFRDSAGYFRFMKDSIYKRACFSAIVFNDKGILVNYKDSASCQWSAAGYIAKLKKDTTYRTDESRMISSVIPSLMPVTGCASPDLQGQGFDYTIIFTWAKYIGKLNDRLFRINEIAKNNPRARLRVISLNVDMQQSWCLREDQKTKLN